MKELPKYFVIKRVENNPLWDKYIEWLNKTYCEPVGEEGWEGETYLYYGFDGNDSFNSKTDCYDNITNFKNNPTELTLEEWDEMVNGFTLPDKWCIKLCTSPTIIGKWFDENKQNNYPGSYCNYGDVYMHYPYLGSKNHTSANPKEEYTEITFEQFKKYVLKETNEMKKYSINDLKTNSKLIVFIESEEQFNKLVEHCGKIVSRYYGPYCYSIYERSYSSTSSEVNVGGYDSDSIIVKFNEIDFMEKKIIGYRLTKKEMYKAASYILHGNSAGSGYLDDVMPVNRVDELREAGVLDLWFEPIYEEEFKVGDWVELKASGTGNGMPMEKKSVIVQLLEIDESKHPTGNYREDSHFMVKYDSRYYRTNKQWVLRKATPEEIAKYSKPDITIKGYKAEFTEDIVSFGCQTYSKDFVLTLAKCLEDNGFDMEIKEEVLQIAKYFKNK